jgi:DNA polymerase III epsilon subunit-like protein
MPNLLVAGSRSIKTYELVKHHIDTAIKDFNIKPTYIVSGKAYGVDRLGEQWAVEHNVKIKEFPADWKNLNVPGAVPRKGKFGVYNVNAGHDRNRKMAEVADFAVILWDGQSTGTKNMLSLLEERSIPTYLVEIDLNEQNKQASVNNRKAIVEWAKLHRDNDSIIIDTETTGLTGKDEVLSVAVVGARNGEVLFNSYIRPSPDVIFSRIAVEIHGITEDKVINSPTILDVWEELSYILKNKDVLAYNFSADKRFLEQTLTKHRLGLPTINWHCVMNAYKRFQNYSKVVKLETACREMNVKAGTHDALSDALATARILYRIAQDYTPTSIEY